MLRIAGCLLLVLLSAPVERPVDPEQPTGGSASAQERSARLSRQRTLAPVQSEPSEKARQRAQALRGLLGMMVLTLLLIALMMVLMILAARWTRPRLAGRQRPKPTTLEDLWWKVKEETLTEVDIDELMSEGEAPEKEKPQDEDQDKG